MNERIYFMICFNQAMHEIHKEIQYTMNKSVLYFHRARPLAIPYPHPLDARMQSVNHGFVSDTPSLLDLENLHIIPFTLSEQDEQSLHYKRRMIKKRMRKVVENNGYEWDEVNWKTKVVLCWKKDSIV
jgi:hypothetical protein